MKPFRVRFQIPPDTSLNSRAHYRAKAHLVREVRRRGFATGDAIIRANPGEAFPVERYSLRYEFVFPDRRSRDLDNFIGRAKPLLDGLIESGLLGDDRVVERLVATKRVEPGSRGEVLIEVVPEDGTR